MSLINVIETFSNLNQAPPTIVPTFTNIIITFTNVITTCTNVISTVTNVIAMFANVIITYTNVIAFTNILKLHFVKVLLYLKTNMY